MYTTYTTYEWDVETVAATETATHEAGEVLDHAHQTSYAEALRYIERYPAETGTSYKIALVRDDAKRGGGRSWAYVVDGKLPEWTLAANGHREAPVPKKFLREVNR